jgi:hypothetical protein
MYCAVLYVLYGHFFPEMDQILYENVAARYTLQA